MPGLRELLSRFRAAGAPGAPGAAGMPVDPRAGVAAELEPVFAALAATTAECRLLRTRGAAESQRRLGEARDRAAAMIAQAQDSERAVRAAEAARRRERSAADLAAVDEESRAAAEEITRRLEARLPALVDEVVERVRRDISALGARDEARAGSSP